ncbi:hypothetical protein STEG23_026220, partial [Scotinomys teguina]
MITNDITAYPVLYQVLGYSPYIPPSTPHTAIFPLLYPSVILSSNRDILLILVVEVEQMEQTAMLKYAAIGYSELCMVPSDTVKANVQGRSFQMSSAFRPSHKDQSLAQHLPETEGNRCRDPPPNIGPAEEDEEEIFMTSIWG